MMDPGPRTYRGASLRVAIPQGLPVEFWETTRELVAVQSSAQGRGEATKLMRSVFDEADHAGLLLLVKPETFAPGLTDEQLRKWYARLNFVEFQAEPCLLARAPQPVRRYAHG